MFLFQVYYDYFPPKEMNVQVKLVPVGEVNGVASALKKTTLVAKKDFKAGEVIYKARSLSQRRALLTSSPGKTNRGLPGCRSHG